MNPAHAEAVKSIKNAVVYKAFLGTAGEMGERFEIDLFAYVLHIEKPRSGFLAPWKNGGQSLTGCCSNQILLTAPAAD